MERNFSGVAGFIVRRDNEHLRKSCRGRCPLIFPAERSSTVLAESENR
jgi:hypothetical protein